MPSLHAAFALLFCLYLWRLVPRWCAAAARALSAGDGVRARLLAASTTSSTARSAGSTPSSRSSSVELRLARASSGAPLALDLRSSIERVRPLHFCDVIVEGARWPVFGWAIERDGGHDPRRHGDDRLDAGARRAVAAASCASGRRSAPCAPSINTHLHFDHCGGNRRFAGHADLRPAGRARGGGRGRTTVDRVGALRRRDATSSSTATPSSFAGVSVLFDARPFARPPGGGRRDGRRARSCSAATSTYSMRELIDGGDAVDRPHPRAAAAARLPRAPRAAVGAGRTARVP